MSNLPDDWGAYYATCHECGERYHRSGVDECACSECSNCGEVGPGREDHCEDCEDIDSDEGECGNCGALAGDTCRDDCRVRAVTSGPVCGGAL